MVGSWISALLMLGVLREPVTKAGCPHFGTFRSTDDTDRQLMIARPGIGEWRDIRVHRCRDPFLCHACAGNVDQSSQKFVYAPVPLHSIQIRRDSQQHNFFSRDGYPPTLGAEKVRDQTPAFFARVILEPPSAATVISRSASRLSLHSSLFSGAFFWVVFGPHLPFISIERVALLHSLDLFHSRFRQLSLHRPPFFFFHLPLRKTNQIHTYNFCSA